MDDKYSVLMAVYKNDNAKFLDESIDSMMQQTVKPYEFVIVLDGPITNELNQVITEYTKKYPKMFKIVKLDKNVGLGKALCEGIKHCKYELIARMDADDYSFPERISKELDYLRKYPEIDLIGTQAIEFTNDVKNPLQYNNFPISHDEIVKYAHSRNPYSHPSVIFKKQAVINAGSYQDAYLCEDYDLWIRMIQNGSKCANLDEYLFAVRVSEDFFRRRGGFKYVKSINNLMKKNMKNGFFTKKDYVKNMVIRSCVYLMPNSLRSLIYTKFLRKEKQNEN